MTAIKICGVTSVADALLCVAERVEAIGLNFVPSSPRVVDLATARAIAQAVGGRALLVAVVADLPEHAIRTLIASVPAGCVQLHGDESSELVGALLPHAYKAVRVASAADAATIDTFPGEHVLADARVAGALGGTGATFDWSLVAETAKRRKLTLAGGLAPGNVASAIAAVAPYCVDTASGVEVPGDPRRKDPSRLAGFVSAVRGRTTLPR